MKESEKEIFKRGTKNTSGFLESYWIIVEECSADYYKKY